MGQLLRNSSTITPLTLSCGGARLPFAGEMLKKVISVCNAYPSTYGVSYSFLLVSLVWMAVWIFGVSGCGLRRLHALIILGFLASLLWTMQVLRNIVRVTVAGTVALFYFQEHNMPTSTTPVALLRCCTSSLGSICFGSFFVPLVEAPCHVVSCMYLLHQEGFSSAL